MTHPRAIALLVAAPLLFAAPLTGQEDPATRERRTAAIHERWVFADMHAHPSRFHRANVARI